MFNPNSIQAAPQRLPSLPHVALQQNTQHAYTEETPDRGLLGGLPDDVWRIIFKKYCQNGASNFCRTLPVSKAWYRLANEARDWEKRKFLFSEEAQALIAKDSLNGLQNVFQIIRGVLEDAKIEQFLFSKEANVLFKERNPQQLQNKERNLQQLQNTFQTMYEAAQNGYASEAQLHRETLQKILRSEFPRIVREITFKQENLPQAPLIQSFLLNGLKRGKFFEAMKLFPSGPLPTYENRYSDIYDLNLTLANLVAIDLGTLEEFGADASLDDEIDEELVLYILTHISSFFNQEQKLDMRCFIELMPSCVWGGVVDTYTNYSLIGVEYLLASKVDAIAGDKTVHWPISEGDIKLLIVLLENNFNPNALDESGKSGLRCAIEADRPDMVDVLLKHDADVSHLLKGDSGINPIHWAISRNREYFLERLLALVVDQNVFNNAWEYAKEVPHVNSTVKILLEHRVKLGQTMRHQRPQMFISHPSKSA